MSGNDYLWNKPGKPKQKIKRNERRAAIARSAMNKTELARLLEERQKWLAKHPNEKDTRDTAMLGRMRLAINGHLTSLRKGDLVLVWDSNPQARTPIYTVWHPRNDIGTVVLAGYIDLLTKRTP